MFELLGQLFHYVNRRRRAQLLVLLCLTFLSSISEVVSLSAIMPFIGVITEPEKAFVSPKIFRAAKFLGISSAQDLILPIVLSFAVAAIIAAAMRLALAWFSIRLTNGIGSDLSLNVYRRTLYQPYQVHVSRSSSEIISGISQKVATVTSLLMSICNVVTSSVLFVAILIALMVIDPAIAFISFVSFGLSYALVALISRRRLKRNSQCIASEQTQVVKALQEGLGAIRDVLLDGTQDVYCKIYSKAIHQLQKANGENSYINIAPRYAMEGLGMVLIAFLALFLSRRSGDISALLPTLGALALGAQRLLPILQQLYANWSSIVGSQAALINVLELLEQPLPDHALDTLPALTFEKSICFEDVGFRYHAGGPWVLRNINLTIPSGARVGFVGSTGSGKSTTLDILMALLQPVEGRVLIDGKAITSELQRSWQRNIAHVPQSIYLADTSVAENIAFGVSPDEIDMRRVERAAVQAQISEFIKSCPEGYGTFVGERGIRLSGGQRQRIGIARALYKEAKVLVLDEATSSLDGFTEKDVMKAIEGLNRNLTILIIAHRLSTLKECDVIVQLEGGRIVAKDSYSYFANQENDYGKEGRSSSG